MNKMPIDKFAPVEHRVIWGFCDIKNG